MAREKDLVCGMEVDPASAPAKFIYQGKTYYFCAPGCKVQFERNPQKYVSPQPGQPGPGH